MEKINNMDTLVVDNFEGNIVALVKERREATSEFWKQPQLKESMFRLKSRQLWLKDDDKNTCFFHNSTKERQRRNAI